MSLATEPILIPASSSTLASRCPSLERCPVSFLRYRVRSLGDLAWRVPGEAGHVAVRNQRLRMFNLVGLR